MTRATASGAVLATALLASLLAGCAGGEGALTGSGGPTDPTLAPTSLPATAFLPPDDVASMAAELDPLLDPLGLRLTRAGLVTRPAPDPSRPPLRHLALYVEPVRPWDDARFVATITPLARLLTPLVFERWAGVASYDVCQEPSPGVDDRAEPPPITVFEVSRAYARTVDWDRVTLGQLVREAEVRPPSQLVLEVTARLRPALAAATGR